jgi:hypothetical protein
MGDLRPKINLALLTSADYNDLHLQLCRTCGGGFDFD